ncbi:MAG TPA: ABC transporter permease [Ktedonobacterales bacterium]|jgi:ABC-type transport system involved in multi-copper enzyme maturation permease subunit
MSTALSSATTTHGLAARSEHPQFLGMLRGEIFKLVRQRFNWITTLGFAGAVSVYYLFLLGNKQIKDDLQQFPYESFYHTMAREGAITRVFIGIVLMIATAMLIGFEYQHGTIRVLLSRGVDRVKLLLAKLLTLALFGLALLALAVLLNALWATLAQFLIVGNLDAYKALNGTFWANTWTYVLSILISMGATILLAAALTVFGRSVAFGLTLSFVWFAAENIGASVLVLVYTFTNNDFWLKITAYLVGLNLNILPTLMVARHVGGVPVETLGSAPRVQYDLTHTLLTVLIYSVIFAVVAIMLTWRRDVKE